jgi:hypothetical protein
MKFTILKLFKNLIYLLLTLSFSTCFATLCSTPPPFNPNGLPYSPQAPVAGDEVFLWVVGQSYQVDSSQVTRVGNTIYLTLRITYTYDEQPGFPPDCTHISLGNLPAGSYTLDINQYIRKLGKSYPLQPSNTLAGPILVNHAPLPVPITHSATVALMLILSSLAILFKWFCPINIKNFTQKSSHE